MRIMFLVPRLDKASTRYRVSQYLPYIEKAGIDYEIKTLSKSQRNWYKLYRQIKNSDIVFIQKKIFSILELIYIRWIAKKIVYDFDDAVMYKDRPASARQHARQRRRFARTLKKSDIVIAGNQYLCEQAHEFNKKVFIIPTPINMERYIEKNSDINNTNQIILGWVGSRGTLKYLEDIAPALESIGKRHTGLALKIVADDFFDLKHIKVIKKNWSAEDEIADLHSFDIGLMPLTDDVWTQGKCGFKLLQCMAVGLPVICSPVGMNREIVSDGIEGLWAETQDQWIGKIELLAKDQSLRIAMGKRGRKKVKTTYSVEVNAPLFLETILKT